MNTFVSKFRIAMRTLAPAATLLALTACQHQMSGAVDDVYMPQMHYENHPIEVAKGTVKLQIPTRSAKLSLKEQDAVKRFAHQVIETEADKVHVRRPAGGNGRQCGRGKSGPVAGARRRQLHIASSILPTKAAFPCGCL